MSQHKLAKFNNNFCSSHCIFLFVLSLSLPLYSNHRNPSCIDTSNVLGFIMNVPSDYKFGFLVLPFRRRHWIAIRKIDKLYWNLDSKLNAPECIGDDTELISYLNNQLKSNDMELFIVTTSEAEKTKKWLKDGAQ